MIAQTGSKQTKNSKKNKKKSSGSNNELATKFGWPLAGSSVPTSSDQLEEISVPISFGTSEEDVLGKEIEYEKTSISLQEFHDEYLKKNAIDVEPPYQRHGAWREKQKSDFIRSVFNKNMAIPPMFLCKKTKRSDCAKFWALDCRQRTTTIQAFFDNKFKIVVHLRWSSGAITSKRLSWSEIANDPNYDGVKKAFLRRPIDMIIMNYMKLSDQRIIFEALNNGSPLNSDEVTYCKHFLTRRVLSDMFAEVFHKIKKHMSASVRDEKRFAQIRTIHEVLILVGGQDWSSKKVEPRPLRQKERLGSAIAIHRKLEDWEFEYEHQFTKSLRQKLGVETKLSTLTAIANLLSDIFEEETMLGREERKDGSGLMTNALNARQIIDPLCFLFGKVQDGTASIDDLVGNQAALVKFLHGFYIGKRASTEGLNQSTSDLKVMKGKFLLMEAMFKKHLGRMLGV